MGVAKIPDYSAIDICLNPEAMCENRTMIWLGAIFYWANDVQGFSNPIEAKTFTESLQKYVSSGFILKDSVVDGNDFASGTGGMVNNGSWTATPGGNAKRVNNFNEIIDLFKAAGMTENMGPGGGDGEAVFLN